MLAALVAGVMVMNSSCGKIPDPVAPRSSGDLEIQVQLSGGLAKKSGLLKTEFDSLVVEVHADDMTAMRFTQSINADQYLVIDTLSRVPAGTGREITVKTINKNGVTVHEDSIGVRTVRVDPNYTTIVQVVLVPVRGSIYLQIAGVPTDIDSLGAVFTSDRGERWSVAVPRSPKVFASIDGIPNGTQGTLTVAGFSLEGDTLYRAQSTLQINARSTNGVQLSFETTPGGVALEGTLQLPGAVTVSGSMSGVPVAVVEQGDLLVTEIMYAANDSEYVEVYNPEETDVYFDSLFLDVDGTKRLFTGVAVGAKSYYVFGRRVMPWVDAAHSVASALDLSGNGNWITLLRKDLAVLDQVAFTGGSNGLEWPRISGKRSICLRGEAYSAEENNYGRNWVIASEPLEGAPAQMGTPHSL